jgi:hypothetical protein
LREAKTRTQSGVSFGADARSCLYFDTFQLKTVLARSTHRPFTLLFDFFRFLAIKLYQALIGILVGAQ